jgi:dihydroorotase-like cyclic amidohydrolase
VVASDHSPYTREEKSLEDVWAVPMGAPGTETLIAGTWRALNKAGGAITDLVRVLCAEPARIFGLHPAKGVIAVGADADFTLIDFDAEYTIDGTKQHNTSGYSIYDGLSSPLRVHSSILRGQPLLRDGTLVREDCGEFVRHSSGGGEVAV